MTPFDALRFRAVLGQFPTGVAVITGLDRAGQPVGMAVGSFTSVSLDPPLVAFLPDKSSTTWPKISASGSFCVNILAAEQEEVCRVFAMRGPDRFADLQWQPAPSRSPVLDGVLAWIDCDIDAVHEAGDHWIVVGQVRELSLGKPSLPLLFFQGGYGRFRSLTLAAWEGDLGTQLRCADLARPQMETIVAELGVECVASAVAGADMVLIANAGAPRARDLPTRVGQRVPFVPPLGTAFVAWAPPAAQRAWLRRLAPAAASATAGRLKNTLDAVRTAGYSVARETGWPAGSLAGPPAGPFGGRTGAGQGGDPASTVMALRSLIDRLPPDYESPAAAEDQVQSISSPVFAADGTVVLVLTLIAHTGRPAGRELVRHVTRLQEAAAAVTVALGGQAPFPLPGTG